MSCIGGVVCKRLVDVSASAADVADYKPPTCLFIVFPLIIQDRLGYTKYLVSATISESTHGMMYSRITKLYSDRVAP
jgi:hypothetical protein